MKYAVLSLSGGMDSTSLLIHLLANDYIVKALSFNYGQKHKVELERAKANIAYLQEQGLQVTHNIIDLQSTFSGIESALTSEGIEVPEGHYEQSNMKQTVVENRNAIFSSIIYAQALSLSKKVNEDVVICLGIHAGDHCFTGDMNILSPGGYKTVDCLKIGDIVFSFNNSTNRIELKPVTDIVKKNIVEEVTRLRTTAGDITLTEEHKVYKGNLINFSPHFGYDKVIEQIQVKDLQVGDFLIQPNRLEVADGSFLKPDLFSIITQRASQLEGIEVFMEDGLIFTRRSEKDRGLDVNLSIEVLVELMAWFISEGHYYIPPLDSRSSRINASFSQSIIANPEKTDRIVTLLKENKIHCRFHCNKKKEMTFYFSGPQALLLQEGGHKADDKIIPEWLMTILVQNKELRELFLHVYTMADGYYGHGNKSQSQICSNSTKLINQVVLLCQLSGYHFRLNRKKKTQYIYISHNQKDQLRLGHGKFVRIKSIDTVPYDDYVYDITVDGNHNFFCGEFGQFLISNSIYPDCRQEFRDALGYAFKIGNWGSERVEYYTPFINGNKTSILGECLENCQKLGLDFDHVLRNTNTSYNPDSRGRASGKSGADIERIEAFMNIGRKDPVEYQQSWEDVVVHAREVLQLD